MRRTLLFTALVAIGAELLGQTCQTPQAPAILFAPPGNVGVGQTYALVWNAVPNLDPTASYVIERSLDASFAAGVESQQTNFTSASFLSTAEGLYFHRVRATLGCDPARATPWSGSRTVNVVAGSPNVIFTVHPKAIITNPGDPLDTPKTQLTLENIGTSAIQVGVVRQEIASIPFFSVAHPGGGDVSAMLLEPRTPVTLDLRFAGPSKDVVASYQGVVFVVGVEPLAITPYAFVNLKIGGSESAAPYFTVGGKRTEYVFFPGYPSTFDDALRAPITVEIRNPGLSLLELGAEVGPEVWLIPEPGWNSTPIPALGTRTVRLTTTRSRAPTGSALPRYTYFTIRTKTGQSARLLVQDNDLAAIGVGRPAPLAEGARSAVIPHVASDATSYSVVRLSNIGGDVVQADLVITPNDADGFDAVQVRRAAVLVPRNDVVTLTDPLVQIFALPAGTTGQMEVQASSEKIAFLTVTSTIVAPAEEGGGFTQPLPVAMRGEGARSGDPHILPGVISSADLEPSLVLAETTGKEATAVKVVLYDASGQSRGERLLTVPRYGHTRIVNVADAIGSTPVIDGGRLALTVESGAGAVVGLLRLVDKNTKAAEATISSAINPPAPAGKRASVNVESVAAVAPVMVNGPAIPGSALKYRTSVGVAASGSSSVSVTLIYRDDEAKSAPVERVVTAPPGVAVQFGNVLEDLFGLPPGAKSQGPLFIRSATGGIIYAKLFSASSGSSQWRVAGALPIVSSLSEAMISATALARRPLYFDGLEQSVDPARGSRWAMVLTEVKGESATVRLRLYEAGNRTAPIAERIFTLGALERRVLDPIFKEMDLDSDERRKDRTNILAVVSAESGSGLVSATAVATDNRTGDTRSHVFSPGGGLPSTGVLRITTVAPVPPPASPRRRAARH